jgi:hypothetical protein
MLALNLAREARPLRNMKRRQRSAKGRRVFVMHECYAVFACVRIRIDLERISWPNISLLKRQEPSFSFIERPVTRYAALRLWRCWAAVHFQGSVIGEDARLTSQENAQYLQRKKLLAQARPDEHLEKQNVLEK